MLAFAMRSSPAPACFLGSVNCTGIASRVLHFSLEPPRDHILEPRFVAPLFSWSYELLFPQPLCIHNDLRCPRGVPFGAVQVRQLSRRIGSKRFHSISYALFGVPRKPNLRRFNHLHSLSARYPGWGYLTAFGRRVFRRSRLRRHFATWTRRAHPTIIAVSSRFQVHG
jgi:hypothetical protein